MSRLKCFLMVLPLVMAFSLSVYSDSSPDYDDYRDYLWKKLQAYTSEVYLTPDAPSETVVEEELQRWPVARHSLNLIMVRSTELSQFVSLLEEKDEAAPGQATKELLDQLLYARVHLFFSYLTQAKAALQRSTRCRFANLAETQRNLILRAVGLAYRSDIPIPQDLNQVDITKVDLQSRFPLFQQKPLWMDLLAKVIRQNPEQIGLKCELRVIPSLALLKEQVQQTVKSSLQTAILTKVQKMIDQVQGAVNLLIEKRIALNAMQLDQLVKATQALTQDINSVSVNYKMMEQDRLKIESQLKTLKEQIASLDTSAPKPGYPESIQQLQERIQKPSDTIKLLFSSFTNVCRYPTSIDEYLNGGDPRILDKDRNNLNSCTKARFSTPDKLRVVSMTQAFGKTLRDFTARYFPTTQPSL